MFRILPILALAACVHTRSVHVGTPRAPKVTDVAYERISLADAASKYAHVGSICVTGTEDSVYQVRDDRLHRAIDERVWELGGDTVSVTGLCTIGRYRGVELSVFAARG